MLWSLIKILLFVAAIAGLTYGAGYLMESEGGVMITVAGVEYTLGPLQSVIALVALIVVTWLVFKLLGLLVATLKFLNGDETAISRYFDRNRERKGYKALSDGLVALASGDGQDAMDKARKAERYLAKPEVTNLLVAQAAEMQGDKRKASETYKKLLGNDSTRFVGVRGLMKQKLDAGNTETALKLAETAFALKPRHVETQDMLLKLQADSGDWKGARSTLSAKLKYGTMPRDLHRRRDAVLALSEAKEVFAEGNTVEAREEAIEANRKSPDLIPAAIMAARAYIEKAKPRYATRVLKKAWDAQPHPDLAAAFAEIEPDETPEARIKRFKTLVKSNPSNAEARMLMAELHIANEDFPEARRTLGDLFETDPTTRSLTIMAAIERGEGGSDAVVKGWLAKAITAPRGPQWVCENCHNIQTEWAPTCGNCESFDTLSWTAPPASEVTSPTGVAMLPLIVGAIEDKADEPVEIVPEAEIIEEADEIVEDTETSEAEPVEDDTTKAQPGFIDK
ncbi:heme biosynthesis HemY N-terminal domain-containing protein [Shimia thalassica]|uniref:heme biosynthesis protein HemY n=1 Tax=Shimia thalassica TaxID=1715693 RepID=UPI0026E469DE|nr:heme biosynthesis HemY N-terminal domain-containing protein [Shimia thalassica]MDO6523344.1 heme biosynthesis HemY N-terminal domain-containing protein [Shimia thalassica]